MAPDAPWILVAAADLGIRRRIKALLPPSWPVLFAGTVDGARDILRHNPVAAVVAEPPLLAALRLKNRGGVRVVAVLGGTQPPAEIPPAAAARVCLAAADASQALQRVFDPPSAADRPVPTLGRMVGASPAMKRVFERIRQVAASDSNVLIQGETGTGKDLAARAVHGCSARRRRPFVVYNCAEIPAGLMEGSLFGHRRGAYTGAHRDRRGYLQAADGGTLFLDDIDNLGPGRQAKLLRILQEKKFKRLGSDREIRIDVRFIAATNRDLAEMLATGALRRDLYYRLNVLPVHIPPLKDREGDVRLLTDYFMSRWAEKNGLRPKPLSAEVRRCLAAHDWPGNVRELASTVERINTLRDPEIDDIRVHLNAPARFPESVERPFETLRRERRKLEQRLVRRALIKSNANRTRAAALLGIHRNTLAAKMKAAGLSGIRRKRRRGD
jgi:transcriptional regulator with PAS, ATPase and Fis domain